MASWKQIVTKTPGDGNLPSDITVGSAASFSGVLPLSQGGTGQSDFYQKPSGLVYATNDSSAQTTAWDTAAPGANQVIGVDVAGAVTAVNVEDSHVHSNYVEAGADAEITGDWDINGTLYLDELSVSTLAIVNVADNYLTLNTDADANDGGVKVYYDGTNDGTLSWDNSADRWVIGTAAQVAANTAPSVGGTYLSDSTDWTAAPAAGIFTGTVGMNLNSGDIYVAIP